MVVYRAVKIARWTIGLWWQSAGCVAYGMGGLYCEYRYILISVSPSSSIASSTLCHLICFDLGLFLDFVVWRCEMTNFVYIVVMCVNHCICFGDSVHLHLDWSLVNSNFLQKYAIF